MKIFKILNSKLTQIEYAIIGSIDEDSDSDIEKHINFYKLFGGECGLCGNMNYDSYNQYNTIDDKIIELGYNTPQNLSNWLDEVESLLTDYGIEDADMFCRWKTREILTEIKEFISSF